MKLSQKSEYALRGMLELARQFSTALPVRSAEIAKNQQIPEKFLELILVELRRAGLIISHRGPEGGHRLSRNPDRISVGEIWRAIDGLPFERTGMQTNDPFDFVWHQVESAVGEIVDGVTLEDIRVRSEARQAAPDFSI